MCLMQTTLFFSLKEHNQVIAHAQYFNFWTGGQEFKDAGMVI